MRPRGEVREAVVAAMSALGEQQALPATWRDLLPHVAAHVPGLSPASPADVRMVRKTVENMAFAGEIERQGSKKVQGVARPMTAYKPRSKGWVRQGTTMLDGVMRGWRIA